MKIQEVLREVTDWMDATDKRIAELDKWADDIDSRLCEIRIKHKMSPHIRGEKMK